MKFLFTTCLICCVLGFTKAQTVLFESFDGNSVPTGWTQTQTSGDGWQFSTNAGYTVSAILDHTGNGGNYAWVDFSGTDAGVILESPVVNVSSLTTPYLQFYFESHYAGTLNPYNIMYLEAWNGTTWVNVNTFQGDTGLGWDEYGFNMSAYVYGGGNIRFRFRCESGGSSSDYYNDLLLDDVKVMELPSCPKPSNLAASNITTNTASIAWTENGTATNWEIQYGTAPFPAGSGTSVFTTTNPHTLTGLPAGSTLAVYVRSICSPGDTSRWTGPIVFNTACATVNAPWTENFNRNSTPNCWNETGSESWRYNTLAGSAAALAGDHTGNGGNYAWIDGSFPSGPNQISSLETPFINVSGLSDPLLSFWVFSHNPNDNTYNTLDVEVYDGAAWNAVRTINSDQGSAWNLVNIRLNTLTITGPIQVRFTVTENSPGTPFLNDILIDDISIKNVPNVGVASILGLQASYCNTAINVDLVVENKTGNVEQEVPWQVFSNGAVIASGSIPTMMPNSLDTIPVSLGGVGPAGANAMIQAYTTYTPDLIPSDDTTMATVSVSYIGLSASVSSQVGCAGGSDGTIAAAGQNGVTPYTYLWNNGQTNATATGLPAGNYTITVTDSIGCSTVAQLALQDPPAMTLAANGTDLTCNGNSTGTVATTVSGGVPRYSYLWNTGSTATQLNNMAAGNYAVTVTDAYGCDLVETVTLNEPTPVVAVVTDNTDGTATASGSGGVAPYTYQWGPNANNQTTATASGIVTGQVYYVVVTDANGCTDVFSFQASRIVSATAVETKAAPRLFPNPTSGNVYLEWATATPTMVQVRLYSITGQSIWNQKVAANQLIELPTANLPAGVYSLQATDGNTQWSQKLIVTQ